MKKITFFALLLTFLLASASVCYASVYEARGITYVPIVETFKGLSFNAEQRIPTNGVIEAENSDYSYTIYAHARLIIKRSKTGSGSENIEPDRSPTQIREEYYLPLYMYEQYFDIKSEYDKANKKITFYI